MKRLKQFAAAVLMTAMMTMTSFGGQWIQDDSGWWYQNDDGSYPVNGWKWIDGNLDGIAECYYFDTNGYCLMNAVAPDGNLVDANGALVIAGVVQTQVLGWPGTADDGGNGASVEAEPETLAETPAQPSYSVETTVWLSATGSKYHRIPNCGRMNPNKARQVSLDWAVAQGFESCKNCY